MSCHVATFAKDLGEVMSCRVATFARNLETYDINICLDPDDIYVHPKVSPQCTVGLGCVGTGAVDLTIQSDRTSAAVKSGRMA